jgi:hypothetical protein
LIGKGSSSLTEISTGMAIIGIIILGAGYFATREPGSRFGKTKLAVEVLDDGTTLARHLNRHVSSGGFRYFSATVTQDGPGWGRFLIPLSGLCRDLSGAGCEDTSGLLYVHREAAIAPAVQAACYLSDVAATGLDPDRYGESALVLDLAAPGSLGAEFDPTDSTIEVNKIENQSRPEGPILIHSGTVLALSEGKDAYLFVGRGEPIRPATAVWGEESRSVQVDGVTLPDNCTRALTLGSEGSRAKVLVLPARPFREALTSGNREASTRLPLLPILPASLTTAQIRVLGFRVDPLLARSDVAIRKCVVDSGALLDQVVCDFSGPDLLPVRGVSRMRLEVVLKNSAQNGPGRRFEPLTPGMKPSPYCNPPSCDASYYEMGKLRVLSQENETEDQLNFDQFSLLKMSRLHKMVLRLRPADSNGDESFEIRF